MPVEHQQRLVVVEFASGAAAAYCGWLFAQSGHEVFLVEPPEGHPLRDARRNGYEREALFFSLAAGKKSVVLNMETASGRDRLLALCQRADVLLTDDAEQVESAVLSGGKLPALAPQLVHTSVTPFGESGPYAGFLATSATLYALGGYTYITGEPDREPLTGPEYFPEFLAGAAAFTGTLAALIQRVSEGTGRKVEVSALECIVAGHQFTFSQHSYLHRTLERTANRYASLVGVTFFPCADGVVALAASTQHQLEQLLLLTGNEHLIGDARFNAMATTSENALMFDREVGPWFATRRRDEVVDECQAFRIPCAAVLEVDEVLEHEQLRARGFWRGVDHAATPRVELPRLPFRIRGEASDAVPAPLLGANEPELESLLRRDASVSRPSGAQHPPLAGIRVLDLTRVWSGPIATRMLGDLGAEVIKVEYPAGRGPLGADGGATQAWNRSGIFNEFNRNKLSLAMDLSIPEAREAFLRVVATCDVVIENYSARVMGNLGIDFATLCQHNPRLVMVSMPGYGLTGPLRDRVAYGTTLDAEAGTASIIGYADEGPMRMGVAFPDYVAGIHGGAATLTALFDREITGKGQHVDLSQFESIVAFMAPAIVDWQLTRMRPVRRGNRHRRFAPSGVYHCSDSAWVAINVTTDEQWRSLCKALRRDDLLSDPSLRSAQGRQSHHAELDAAIGKWTALHPAGDCMWALQRVGVPAGAVLSAPALFADPHLRERGFFVGLDHPLAGRHEYPGLPIRMQGVAPGGWTDAPCLGEHNTSVLTALADCDDNAIARLAGIGAIADRPPA